MCQGEQQNPERPGLLFKEGSDMHVCPDHRGVTTPINHLASHPPFEIQKLCSALCGVDFLQLWTNLSHTWSSSVGLLFTISQAEDQSSCALASVVSNGQRLLSGAVTLLRGRECRMSVCV